MEQSRHMPRKGDIVTILRRPLSRAGPQGRYESSVFTLPVGGSYNVTTSVLTAPAGWSAATGPTFTFEEVEGEAELVYLQDGYVGVSDGRLVQRWLITFTGDLRQYSRLVLTDVPHDWKYQSP